MFLIVHILRKDSLRLFEPNEDALKLAQVEKQRLLDVAVNLMKVLLKFNCIIKQQRITRFPKPHTKLLGKKIMISSMPIYHSNLLFQMLNTNVGLWLDPNIFVTFCLRRRKESKQMCIFLDDVI